MKKLKHAQIKNQYTKEQLEDFSYRRINNAIMRILRQGGYRFEIF